ncbi:DMT family transporter [Streptomyces sp. PTD5-9]|uniref:DMT family transporter n=1 Tax=Streptomyces sp. PTD5-9 TaxID=3120150 RepID=UPI003FCD35A0
MSSLALSVLLSLVSAVAYAAGAIVQEHVAAAGDGRPLDLVRNRVWWAAVTLNGAGAVLHVLALAFGPLTLVQPLGALTIVFALPMAAVFVRRRAGATAWRGAVPATAGLAGLLALTGDSGALTLSGPDRLGLAGVTLGTLGALLVLSRGMRRPVTRGVVLAVAAGIAFGMASVFTKEVADRWSSGALAAGVTSLPAIAVFAAAGLLLSQTAYRGAGLAAPLATVTVVNPAMAAAVGITLFDERFRYGTTGAVLALVCGAVAAGGIVLLTTERPGTGLGAGRADGSGSAGNAHETGDVLDARETGDAAYSRSAASTCGARAAASADAGPTADDTTEDTDGTGGVDEGMAGVVTAGSAVPGSGDAGPLAPVPARRNGMDDDLGAAGPPAAVQTLTPPALR